MPIIKDAPQGDRRNKGTPHRRTGTPQAESKGHRPQGLTRGHRDTTTQQDTHPPPAEEAKGLLTPPKIRAIFFGKPFSMQHNLAKSGNWSRESRD